MKLLPRLFMATLVVSLAACGARLTSEERMDRAVEMLKHGEAQAAVIELKNVLQEDPSNVQARMLLAESSLRAGDFDTAAKEFQRSIDLGGDIEKFRVRLAEALVRAGGIDDALRVTDPEIVGDAPDLRLWRALALVRAGRLEEAGALLDSITSPPPALYPRIQIGRARLALTSQRPREALEYLATVAEEAGSDVDYLETQAYASMQVGAWDDATEAFRKASRAVSDSTGERRRALRAGEVEALLAAGRLGEARERAEHMYSMARRNPVSNYLMSRVELQAGDANQALAYAQAILATDRRSSLGNMMAGAASLALGNMVQAEQMLERAVSSNPDNLPARKLLAQARLGMRAPERALETLGPLARDGGDAGVAAIAGEASVRAGDPEAAVEIFRRQLARTPDDEKLRSMLVVSLMAAGRTEEALAELEKIPADDGVTGQRTELLRVAAHIQSRALIRAREAAASLAAAHPDNTRLRNSLGGLFLAGGQLDDAQVWFESSLALNPDDTAAIFNLGRIAAMDGRLEEARTRLAAVVSAVPASASALTALGQVEWASGNREAALARMEAARQADPSDTSSRYLLTIYLVQSGRAADAVPVAREALALAPDAGPSANGLGVALLESGQPGEALAEFQRAHRLVPGEARYLLNQARALAALGQPERVRQALVETLAVDSDNVAALAALVDAERQLGNLDAAQQALMRLERAAGQDDPRVAQLQGELLMVRRDYTAAEQAFIRARDAGLGGRAVVGIHESRRLGGFGDPAAPLKGWLAERPDDRTARAVLANYYLETDDQPLAVAEYERLVRDVPDDPVVLNNLAWLYDQAGDKRALSLAEQAHKLAPSSPSIADTLAWILHRRGESGRARELLATAAEQAPDAGEIQFHYAVVLAALGDRAEAIRRAQAVLANVGAANYHESASRLIEEIQQGGD